MSGANRDGQVLTGVSVFEDVSDLRVLKWFDIRYLLCDKLTAGCRATDGRDGDIGGDANGELAVEGTAIVSGKIGIQPSDIGR